MIRIAILTGEPSGDVLACEIIKGLQKKLSPNADVSFYGLAGPLSERQGQLNSWISLEECAHMGVEALVRLPFFLRLIRQTAQRLIANPPDILITVDAPDLTLRIARRMRKGLKKRHQRGEIKTIPPHIHCVAPSVWAWRPGRARKLAKLMNAPHDRLLALFPFEPPFFEKEGLKTHFIGHPLHETIARTLSTLKQPSPRLQKTLLILPGSRRSEIKNLLPTFLETFRHLKFFFPDINAEILTLPNLRTQVESLCRPFSCDIALLTPQEDEKYALFARADAALAASGTVTLELALCGTPCVAGYRLPRLVGWIMRRLLRTPWVSLPNILLSRNVITECLQEKCCPDALSRALTLLLSKNRPARCEVSRQLQESLKTPLPFSERAAEIILTSIKASQPQHRTE